MPAIRYQRYDFPISIEPDGDGTRMKIAFPAASGGVRLTTEDLLAGDRATVALPAGPEMVGIDDPIVGDRVTIVSPGSSGMIVWRTHDPSAPLRDPELAAALASWNGTRPPSVYPTMLLPRVTVEVHAPDLVATPWEQGLQPLLPSSDIGIVRHSPVPPRAGTIALTLPLRAVEIGISRELPVDAVVQQVFGGTSPAEWRNAFEVARCLLDEVLDLRAQRRWPTAEVLHINDLLRVAPHDALFATADPRRTGTLGWFLRLCTSWQTRLVVLATEAARGQPEWSLLLRFADALVARGGPAVLLLPMAPLAAWNGPIPYHQPLYDGLIHDQPLDVIAMRISRDAVLFAGAGREDALRPSVIAASVADDGTMSLVLSEVVAPAAGTPTSAEGASRAHLRSEVARVQNVVGALSFDHETKGVIPLSRALEQLRSIAASDPPLRAKAADAALEGHAAEQSRHLNTALFSPDPGVPRRIDPAHTRLVPGTIVHLGVQIGPRDNVAPIVGVTALFEEVFQWSAASDERVLEVAVTGIDFDVLGDPVQELAFAANGPTDMLRFAVVPRYSTTVAGVARLRISVYYGNNVLYVVRLAALLAAEHGPVTDRAHCIAALATALGLSDREVEQAGARGYLTRVEYNAAQGMRSVDAVAPRPLSLVVNDSAGQAIVSLKGNDLFGVQVDDNLPAKVNAFRDTLFEISSADHPIKKGARIYAFFDQAQLNRGTPDQLKKALARLAERGFDLYSRLVPARCRPDVARVLADEGQVIHVAHVDLEKVIPWSLLYDRKYDAGRTSRDGKPVAHDTCLAALPGKDREFATSRCGASEACLLHPTQVAAREQAGLPMLCEDTVACPLHFWGFRHVIEVPPQQARADGSAPPPSQSIECDKRVRIVAGVNAGLELASTHLAAFEEQLGKLDPQPCFRRDAVVDSWDRVQPDIVYLYCHARPAGTRNGTAIGPHLEFGAAQEPPGQITAAEIGDTPWSHHPLVFMNGCATAGFSPAAPSEFVLGFVRDRGAGGVIGTEVTVWEALAGEMALRFFERFTRPPHPTAGQALLDARRHLLAMNNPLGLVYTLYAQAGLTLAGTA